MKVAIFGCRDGEYLLEQIRQSHETDFEPVCFCDNDKSIQGKRIGDLLVVSVDDLAGKYRLKEIDAIIVSVRKGFSRYCIVRQLQEMKISRIILLRPSSLTFRQPIVFDKNNPLYSRYWVDILETTKPIIHHLEAHAADGCNLNCKGCLHFSNLYAKDEFPDLDALLEDIEEIDKHCEIFQFRILGGEPLLNPQLPVFLRKLRQILPWCDLAVISNGILIPKSNPELFHAMDENGIGFNLTLYPPTRKMKTLIVDTLQKYNVPFGAHVAKTDEFEKFMTLDGHCSDIIVSHQKCVPRGIMTLKNGKLYKCPVEAYGERYRETFQIPIKGLWNGVDIREKDLNWGETVDRLTSEPIELCRFCSSKSEVYEWSIGKPQKEDWLISD